MFVLALADEVAGDFRCTGVGEVEKIRQPGVDVVDIICGDRGGRKLHVLIEPPPRRMRKL